MLGLDEQDRSHLIFLVRKEHKDIYHKAEKALEVLGNRETLTAQEVLELNLLKGGKVQRRARQEDVPADNDEV